MQARFQASATGMMAHAVTYGILDCPDGRFAVVAVSASGSMHSRGGFLTLVEAEACAECLRELMMACGATCVRQDGEHLRASVQPPLRSAWPPH